MIWELITKRDNAYSVPRLAIKGMRKLLEKYYNINYYCTYKLLFFIFWRMLNPLYWLSLLKWDNRYIKWLVSTGKKIEEGGMDKGIYLPYSTMALSTPCFISLWICCLVCLAYIKIFRISLLSILGNGVFILLLILIGICGYYVNEIFLLKGDKYKKYFAEFDKKKKYLLYYSIYVVSLIIQFATFYLLFSSVWGYSNWKVKIIMSYIEAERLGRVLIWAWNKYVKKTAIPYKEIDFHYSDWVFLLTGLVFFGIALGIILLYFAFIR